MIARAVIFDCDGVLVDSEEISCSASAELLRAHGLLIDTAEIKRRFLGKSIDAVFEHCASIGRPLPPSYADDKERLYEARARGVLRAMPEIERVLEELRRREIPIAVATSGTPAKVAFSLKETNLARFFDVVVTSSEVARGKPSPDLFLHTARALAVEPASCVVVEDSTPGIAASRAASMLTVGYPSSHARATLVEAGAHRVIDRLSELLSLPELAG